MSYVKHNYSDGTVLHAQSLNEMDDAIYNNDTSIKNGLDTHKGIMNIAFMALANTEIFTDYIGKLVIINDSVYVVDTDGVPQLLTVLSTSDKIFGCAGQFYTSTGTLTSVPSQGLMLSYVPVVDGQCYFNYVELSKDMLDGLSQLPALQMRGYVFPVVAVADTIGEITTVPSGHLFALAKVSDVYHLYLSQNSVWIDIGSALNAVCLLCIDFFPYYKGSMIGIWTADAFTELSSCAPIRTDLYDIDVTPSAYQKVASTDTLISSLSWYSYSTSVFQGWCSWIGKPANIDVIKIPVTTRVDHPITSMRLVVRKMPDIDSIDLGTANVPEYANSLGATLVDQTVTFEEALLVGDHVVEFVLINPIVDNTDELFATWTCNDVITARMARFSSTRYSPTYPWTHNAWGGYSTSANIQFHTNLYPGATDIKTDLSQLVMIDIEYGIYSVMTYSQHIKTTGAGKFAALVDAVLNDRGLTEKINSTYEGFSSSFTKVYYGAYDGVGTQNMETSPNGTLSTLVSTFTGEAWPIGKIPASQPINGFSFMVACRDNVTGYIPMTTAFVDLYRVDHLAENADALTFTALNPYLLYHGEVAVSGDYNTPVLVTLFLDEPLYNTTESELYLGIHIDAFWSKVFCIPAKTVTTYCSAVDGVTYTKLDCYYTTTKVNVTTSGWSRVWANDTCTPWCLVHSAEKFVLGESMISLIDETVTESIPSIVARVQNADAIRLAKHYYCVVGDTFQLFYQGITRDFNYKNLAINIRCSKGSAYPRYWEYTPVAGDVGTYSLVAEARDCFGVVISSGTTTIHVLPIPTLWAAGRTVRNCLMFGDSLTSGGYWCGEGMRRLVGTDAMILPSPVAPMGEITEGGLSSYGKKSATVNGYVVHHEGYGGWTWASFLSSSATSSTTNGIIVTLAEAHGYNINDVQKSIWVDNNNKQWELEDLPSTTTIKFNRGPGNTGAQSATSLPTSMTCSTLSLSLTVSSAAWESGNPFWDEGTESVNFLTHATECGCSAGADYVACLLTWNGGGGSYDGSFNFGTKISTHMTNATTLLRIIHNTLPNLRKIIVMGIQCPSITGGSGANYGSNGSYADMWGTVDYSFEYNKALEELVTNSEFGAYCIYIDTKAQFDTENCMPYAMVAKNTRVSDTEVRGTNGVHPSLAGYNQIGDAYFRGLCYALSLET